MKKVIEKNDSDFSSDLNTKKSISSSSLSYSDKTTPKGNRESSMLEKNSSASGKFILPRQGSNAALNSFKLAKGKESNDRIEQV